MTRAIITASLLMLVCACSPEDAGSSADAGLDASGDGLADTGASASGLPDTGSPHGGGVDCCSTKDSWFTNDLKATPEYRQLAAGDGFTCALLSTNKVQCWGKGLGASDHPLAKKYFAVFASGSAACAITEYGTARCWGAGVPKDVVPTKGQRLATFIPDADGGCGLTTSGKLYCVGQGAAATHAPSSGTFRSLAVDKRGACAARKHAGEVVCWPAAMPTPPSGTTLMQISAGGGQLCGRAGNGKVVCWGGHGTTELPAGNFFGVTVGYQHGCAIRNDGKVKCWGTGAAVEQAPDDVQAKALASGRDHACALTKEGEVRCWGSKFHLGSVAPLPPYTPWAPLPVCEGLSVAHVSQWLREMGHGCSLASDCAAAYVASQSGSCTGAIAVLKEHKADAEKWLSHAASCGHSNQKVFEATQGCTADAGGHTLACVAGRCSGPGH